MKSTRSLTIAVCGLSMIVAAPLKAQQHEGHTHETEPTGPQPHIVIPQDTIDFGEVWIGQELNHEFEVRNTGEAALNISRVRPDCGCTVAKHDKELAVGASGKISTVLKTRRLASGPFHKTISVISNDTLHRRMTLHMRGTVKYYVDINPRSAHFGELKAGESQTRVIQLKNQSDRPLMATLDKSQLGSSFEAVLTPTSVGQAYSLTVTTRPSGESGRVRGTLLLKTNMPVQEEIKIAVSAEIAARLHVDPSSITILAASKSASQRTVRFTNNGTKPVHVLGATINDPRVAVSLIEKRAGFEYDITLNMPPEYLPSSNGATLLLRTDDAAQPQLEVALRSRARPALPAEGLVGKTVPAVEFETLQGTQINTAALENPLVMLFYTSWDVHSKRMLPVIDRLRPKYAEEGIRFVAVSMDDRPGGPRPASAGHAARIYSNEKSLAALKKLGVELDVYMDPDRGIGQKHFQVTRFPTLFVINKEGRVLKVNVGALADERGDSPRSAWSVEELEEMLGGLTTE